MLTNQQKKIVDFIRRYHDRRHIAPALQDIADKFHKSRMWACKKVQSLEEKGYVARQKGIPRSLKVL
jgi:SOS-response transcriptional repressor LexA